MEQDAQSTGTNSDPSTEKGAEKKRKHGPWFWGFVIFGVLCLLSTVSPIMRRLNNSPTDLGAAMNLGLIKPNNTEGPRYFVLVQGCIPPTPCMRTSIDSWGEYGALIKELFDKNNWGKGANNGQDQTFDEWAAQHVRYVGASWLGSGEDGIKAAVSDIVAKDPQANIHILGHSIAGGSIARYLLDSSEGDDPGKGRVRSAVMVDSPILTRVLVVPMVGQRVWDLGEVAKKMGIIALSVDTPNDFVGAFSVKDLLDEDSPVYPEATGTPIPKRQKYWGIALPPSKLELTWHDHTSRHLATQLREFLLLEWQ